MKKLPCWALFISIISHAKCFIPAEFISTFLDKIGDRGTIDLGQVSSTLVHEEILRRGVIASVTRFLIDNPTSGSQVSYDKLNQYYQDVRNLYLDYYGVWVCEPRLNQILRTNLEPNVAIVDFSPQTKSLPTAHFDAELFEASNQRVINFTNQIYAAFDQKDYVKARELSGQIMHTIQDFYSHSNWVEMGKTEINRDIGTTAFNNTPVATLADNITCVANCTLVDASCSTLLTVSQSYFDIKCPMQYFQCENNIVVLDKLVSGYYSEQELEDGTPVKKPEPSGKCSHGGLLDKDAYLPAAGGINKDAGFYAFSPHANLHLTAANLAVNHSEYFFNQIRAKVGDSAYNDFLSIYIGSAQLELAGSIGRRFCSAWANRCCQQFLPPFLLLIGELLLSYALL